MQLEKPGWVLWMLLALAAVPAGAQVRRKARSKEATPARVTMAQIAEGKTYGVKSAAVRIDEYSDFECPACRALYLGTLRQLIDQDVARGTVYLVVHDFPLPPNVHAYSHRAAYLADAAAAIGQFRTVEDALFTHQPEWAVSGKIVPFLAAALTPAELNQVEELARSKEIQDAVQEDYDRGRQANVGSTPTMFVTHKGQRTPLIGVITYPILHNFINALLQQ